MKVGQFYGTVGQVGYGPVLMQIYSQEAERLRRLELSNAEQQAKLRQYALKYETEANKFLTQQLKFRQDAIKAGAPSAGVLSQFIMAQVKIQGLISDIERQASKRDADTVIAEAEAIKEVSDKFNFETYQASGRVALAANSALATVDKATDTKTIVSMINQIIDQSAQELRRIPADDVDQLGVVLNGIKTQILTTLDSKGRNAQRFVPVIDKKLDEVSGVNSATYTANYLDNRKAEELALLPNYNSKTSEALNKLKTLYGETDDLRKKLGGETEQTKEAQELFINNEGLKELFRAIQATDFDLRPEIINSIAERNNTTPKQLLEDFEKAKSFSDKNPALVPEEFVPLVTSSVFDLRQKAAQTKRQQQQLETQKAPDLERLAAERFLASTPRSLELYTRDQRRDIRKGKVVTEIGSKIEQTDRSIRANLAGSEDYRNWYNSQTKGVQVMQRYGTTADELFKEMQSNPNFTPKGRGQKFAMQLFEASQNQMLTADQLVNQTAEGLRSEKDQDEARAYYAALYMNKNAPTQAPSETVQAQQELAVPDMDLTFRDRLNRRLDLRRDLRQDRSRARQGYYDLVDPATTQSFRDPNNLANLDPSLLPNRPQTDLERLVQGPQPEASTAVPMGASQAIDELYPDPFVVK